LKNVKKKIKSNISKKTKNKLNYKK